MTYCKDGLGEGDDNAKVGMSGLVATILGLHMFQTFE